MENQEITIKSIFEEHLDLFAQLKETLSSPINSLVEWLVESLSNGNKIVLAGNGGSAADSQHIAAEFIGRFKKERRSLPAIALTTDTSILTAVSNDYGYEKVFSRQVEGLMTKGDLFLAISTSGNSSNLIEAVKVCQELECRSVGLLGNTGGRLAEMVDLPIIVSSSNNARIQEAHITIGHIVCEIVEQILVEP